MCILMKRLLILILILFISISVVSASDNSTDSVIGDSDEGLVCEESDVVLHNGSGETVDDDSPAGNSSGNGTGGNSSGDVAEGNGTGGNATGFDFKIKADDLVWYYAGNPVFSFMVVDSNGTGVANETVSVTLKNKTYNVTTGENGVGSLPINLKAGDYTVELNYGNETLKKKISLFASRILRTTDLSSTYGTKVKYVLKLLDNAGKPMAGVKVKFVVNKKTYYKTTNDKGFANLYLNLNSGKYVIKYSVKGFSGKNNYIVTNKISLQILKWGLVGDVSKAPLIKKNMPKNTWVKKAVEATKKGLPLITIVGGKGKVVFMTAGVHGNELNSQVAAMKMIDYLTTHKIKGTVYIIPFVNVKAISQKVRLTNYDFNRVAHIKGTVSNNIIKLIFKKKCDYYGDFHTTVSPGVPGLNIVLGFSSPSKCVPLTNYIAKNANVYKKFYYPGNLYTWTLADWCNYNGIPAVICEVISPVNEVSSKATSLSYKEMTQFLKYGSII